MKVEITATAKEIAGLVLALQGQRGTVDLNLPDGKTLTRYLFQAEAQDTFTPSGAGNESGVNQ